MRQIKFFSFLLTFFSMLILSSNAQTKIFESALERTGTIELFTSEGCSSCPPADDWLNQLEKSKDLWTRWIPMVFHVDYWDYLGWKDPWSSPEFSKRQRTYAALWNSDSVYTPEMVLNGKEWRNWHHLGTLPNTLNLPKPGILKAEASDSGEIKIKFSPEKSQKFGASFLVHAAVLGFDQISNVKSGENRGKLLRHHFNVLEHVQAPMKRSSEVLEGKLDLSTFSESRDIRRAIVVWISSGEDPIPIQATGGEW